MMLIVEPQQHTQSFVSLRQAAYRLGVAVTWLKAEAEAGRVPALRAGNRLLFNIEAVEASLMQRAASVPADDDAAL